MATAAVAVRLPEFWPTSADFWFLQAEAQFDLKNITAKETRYYYVVATLSQETARRVMPTLLAKEGYDALKTELLRVFDLSDEQRADRILDLHGLGDKLTFVLTREVQALILKAVQPGYLEHQIFLRQLPVTVRSHMVAQISANWENSQTGTWPPQVLPGPAPSRLKGSLCFYPKSLFQGHPHPITFFRAIFA